MERVEIKVEGMTCSGCVNSIQNALNQCAGVTSAMADLDSGVVTVEIDPATIGRETLEAAITDAGFDLAA